MNTVRRAACIFCVAMAMLFCTGLPTMYAAQGQSGQRPRERQPETGRTRGRIASASRAPGTSDSLSRLVVQIALGRRETFLVDEQSILEVVAAELTPAQLAGLFQSGADITVDWEEAIDPRTGGRLGRRVVRAVVAALVIEGTVEGLTPDGFSGMAIPKQRPREDYEPPRIRVEGRGRAASGNGDSGGGRAANSRRPASGRRNTRPLDETPPTPKHVKFRWESLSTRLTLAGAPATAAQLLAAWQSGRKLGFDAVVTDGNPQRLAEFHARPLPAGK